MFPFRKCDNAMKLKFYLIRLVAAEADVYLIHRAQVVIISEQTA